MCLNVEMSDELQFLFTCRTLLWLKKKKKKKKNNCLNCVQADQ